jgi:SPP1 family predicted phage head-tail adaptor
MKSIRNSTGEVTPQWEDLAEVWAGVEPISGRERYHSHKELPTEVIRVFIRGGVLIKYELTPKDRIKFGIRVFDIEAIINEREHGDLVEIYCSEKIDGSISNN